MPIEQPVLRDLLEAGVPDSAFSLEWDQDLQNSLLQLRGDTALFSDALLQRILELSQGGWFDICIDDDALRARYEEIEERSPLHHRAREEMEAAHRRRLSERGILHQVLELSRSGLPLAKAARELEVLCGISPGVALTACEQTRALLVSGGPGLDSETFSDLIAACSCFASDISDVQVTLLGG